MVDYVLEGPRWGAGAVGSGGGLVSWAVDASIPATFVDDIKAAFSDWSAHANISFQQVTSLASAQIGFTDSYIDGLNNILGETSYSYSSQSLMAANVIFDSGESWHSSGGQVVSADGINFFMVALHEIGHAIGLDHYNAVPAAMNAYIDPSLTDLTTSDIDGIQALYGRPPLTTTLASTFGTTAHEAASPGGEVYALYDGLLGRAPDMLGLEYYADQISHGVAPASLAANFLASPEGQVRLGAADDTAFVQQLYQNTLHRAADSAGLQYYTDHLAHGESRVDVADNFVFSPEHLSSLQPTFDAGVFVPDAQASEVARLYYTMLGRAPDANGLAYWTNQLDHGGSASDLAQGFLNSPENQATYGKLSNSAYVDALYVNALGRHAESGGLNYWTAHLDQGESRADLAVQLSQSAEAQTYHLAQIEQGWHLS